MAYSLDPVLWAREVLGYHPDPWQADLLRSRSRKIILNCSRQSGKSTTCAALGLHESIYRRPSFGLVVAPTQDQSSELMLKFDEFRGAVELPSDYLSTDTKLAVRFANGNRFIARPGSEKSARSFSAVTLLLEDEASRVLDDLYNSVRPMLAVSNGRHILMSTPLAREVISLRSGVRSGICGSGSKSRRRNAPGSPLSSWQKSGEPIPGLNRNTIVSSWRQWTACLPSIK
jgi:hypothetical protein